MEINHMDEIRALVSSGDIDLQDEREKFKRIIGRYTSLTNDQLIEAIALTDDTDDDLFVKNVIIIEERNA